MHMLRGRFCAFLLSILVPAAAGWAEFQVNEYTNHDQTHPAVAMSKSGDFAVAWRSHIGDGRGGGVFARCFHADGNPCGGEFKVNRTQIDVDNWAPAVALTEAGNVIVAWIDSQNGNCDLVARVFDAQGQPVTEEFTVGFSSAAAAQSMPSISMDSGGRFVIVWTNWTGGAYVGRSHVAGRVFQLDGSALSDEFVVAGDAQACWPDVAMDDSNKFVVTWLRMGDTYNRPYGEYVMFRQYKADGTPAGNAVRVTGDLCNRWYGPSIAVDGGGQFALTWAIGPFPYDICMQTFDASGTAVTAPYIINTCLAGNQGHPCIAGNGQGEYLVVWDSQDQDGAGLGVFGQCCRRDGDLQGPELPLTTYTMGRQWYPEVAMAPNGQYVVVWLSQDQDGSGYGVFAETGPK
jgi:hypothetical protein